MQYSTKKLIAIGAMAALFLGACGDAVGQADAGVEQLSQTDANRQENTPVDETMWEDPTAGGERQLKLSADGGFIIAGAPAKDAEAVEVEEAPITGLAPRFMQGLADLNISRVAETLERDGTYEYQVDFTADVSYPELCSTVVSAGAGAGYEGFDNCAAEGDALLDHEDGSELRFLTVNGERAVIIVEVPSSDQIDVEIDEQAPTWMTLPVEQAIKMRRTMYGTRVVTQFDYDSQDNFERLCNQLAAESLEQGFERISSKECDADSLPSVSFKNGPAQVKISNAYEPIMRFETQLDLEEWAAANGAILPTEQAPADEEADPVDDTEQTQSDSDAVQGDTKEAQSGSEAGEDNAGEDNAARASCVGEGIVVNADGSVCQDGVVAAMAPTGRNPIELGDLADDIELDVVTTSIEQDGTYSHELDFQSEDSYADLCDRFVETWRSQGYVEVNDDCVGGGHASLKRDVDDSRLRFVPLKGGRAIVTFKAPSNNDVAEIVAASVPSWSTQPSKNPVKLERIVSAEQVDLEIDYANDGMFPQHCEKAMGEAIGQGFEVRSQMTCENGAGLSFERSNLTFRVTNAYEPLITYKYLVGLDG